MPTIPFKDKNGDKNVFRYWVDMFPGFCAWDIFYDFSVDDWDEEPDFWDSEPKAKPVAESRLFKTILSRDMGTQSGVGTTLFMGDEKGGLADTHIFPYVPKKPFTIKPKCLGDKEVRCKAVLTPYYHNPNSGNQVRHVIITTKLVKEKA